MIRTHITIAQTKFLEWLLTYKQSEMTNIDKMAASVAIKHKGWVSKTAQKRLNSLRERFISDYETRKF